MSKTSKGTSVLLVDDDDTFRRVMSSELTRRGYVVVDAASGSEALKKAAEFPTDVTLLDLRLPDMDGIEVLEQLRDKNPEAGVVVLTGHGTIDTAIQAIRLGAHDYLEKPCPIEKLEMAVAKTSEHGRLIRRQRVLEDGYSAPDVAPNVVGTSPAFIELLENVERIARAEATTLILGETGVGKELVATLVHAQSPRNDGPFVVVDCAALHEELLQSELFGHERGAFTGAARQKHGLFEVANGGTIFLDEVGDTSPDIQAKLLRVLETARFRRLGGTVEIAVDVRVVAATNRDLRQAISRGHFREDLFYRLATLTLEIPPLRQRREDIRELVEHFTRKANRKFSLSREVSEEAVQALMKYRWPGNVRELRHVLEQTIVLSRGDSIEIDDLPATIRSDSEPLEPERAGVIVPLQEVERRHILSVLEKVGGNRSQAAQALGISERNLYRLLKKYRQPAGSPESDDAGEPS
jgi:DNA-binding NtrC family response regulator